MTSYVVLALTSYFLVGKRMKINLISRKLSVITGRNLQKERGSASMFLQIAEIMSSFTFSQ